MNILILTAGIAAMGASTTQEEATSPARQISGSISSRDYPAALRGTGARGTTVVQITIDPYGRVTFCTVIALSGHAALDDATCPLVMARFRYRPATVDGRPVASTTARSIAWSPPR